MTKIGGNCSPQWFISGIIAMYLGSTLIPDKKAYWALTRTTWSGISKDKDVCWNWAMILLWKGHCGPWKMNLCFRNTTKRLLACRSISVMTLKRVLIHLCRILSKCLWRVIYFMATSRHLLEIFFRFNSFPSSVYALSFNTRLKYVKLLCGKLTLWCRTNHVTLAQWLSLALRIKL